MATSKQAIRFFKSQGIAYDIDRFGLYANIHGTPVEIVDHPNGNGILFVGERYDNGMYPQEWPISVDSVQSRLANIKDQLERG